MHWFWDLYQIRDKSCGYRFHTKQSNKFCTALKIFQAYEDGYCGYGVQTNTMPVSREKHYSEVDKSSNYPYFLAIQFLYQEGQTDIVIIDVV